LTLSSTPSDSPPLPPPSSAALQAHRELLLGALRRTFGDFQEEALEQLLPQVEWVEVGGGEVLFEQGEADQSLYFVVSGRLRARVTDDDGTERTIGEIARGETVGEMAFFTGEPRTATVSAVRDSVLARFTSEVFRAVLLAYPLVTMNMTRLVIERLKRASFGRQPATKPVTLGLAAISEGVDLAEFAQQLGTELARHGTVTVVTAERMSQWLGTPGAAQASREQGELSRRVTAKLEEIEAENQLVLFVADPALTPWTRRCLRHCDEIILVADADQPPALHPIERECLADGMEASRSARILVLMHPEARRTPRNTAPWLEPRRLTQHVHLRRGLARDWQRLGRIVSGNAVGLVLSGGGARGFAHLGIYQALEEEGMAFDMVAGTSIGAAMAAYVAMDVPAKEAIRLAGEAFRESPTGDFNLFPLVSLIGGRKLRSAIDYAVVTAMGDHVGIEDLWKNYFCVSSNYSTAREAVLTRGHLAKSIRASVSIPGALPPVMLDGELHIDGGTFNNFPTDVMSRMGAARIIGSNLLRDSNRRYDLEEVPSPMALLRDRLRGRAARKHRLPSLPSLMLNSSIMNSYARQRESQSYVDLYFTPQVHRYGMLQWAAFDKIVNVGYDHAREVLAAARPEQLLPLRADVQPGPASDPQAGGGDPRHPDALGALNADA
jgi:NTE family protein